MTQILQCHKCGSQNMLGMRFCTICGEKFLYKCPQCGTNIDSLSEYCSLCAAKLDWGTATEQQMDIVAFEPNKSAGSALEEVKGHKAERGEQPQHRGMSPWLIAIIIVVVLIAAIFAIDIVLKF